ncbi:MAG: tyramine oxidase subunit B [Synergistaceae bacterium]|nr:tyramine oxidase subunit B [Synergistaceae bacterium]
MGKKTEILFLSEPDMLKAGVLDSARCIDVLDEVFQLMGAGDYLMGGYNGNEHGHAIFFPKESRFPNMPVAGPDRRFMAMVGYLGGRFNVCGEKWYGSNIENPAKELPRSIHLSVLNDPVTCEPLAIMSANLVSAIRTGAVPGLSTRYLTRKNTETCTLIGAGPINKSCFKAIATQVKSLKQFIVYDLFPEKSETFIQWAEKETGIKGKAVKSLEEAVRQGDIVNVAASALKPVEILDSWISKGSVVILSGAARFDDAALLDCQVVYDNPLMQEAYKNESYHFDNLEDFYAKEKGGQFFRLIDERILPPFSESLSLCKMANGEQTGRRNDDERFIFLTAGMSVFDIAWSFECYTKAKSLGLGVTLPLWENPYWL